MAQHAPITNIATTTGLTSGALGIYMHHAWQALLAMSSLSLGLMLLGHVRFLLGKRALAKQSSPKSKPSAKKFRVIPNIVLLSRFGSLKTSYHAKV